MFSQTTRFKSAIVSAVLDLKDFIIKKLMLIAVDTGTTTVLLSKVYILQNLCKLLVFLNYPSGTQTMPTNQNQTKTTFTNTKYF